MILDYVSSGNSSLKFYREGTAVMPHDEIVAAKAILKGLSKGDRRYSVLFNAFTETSIGEACHNHFQDVVHSIHADSGGLQMITLGKSIDAAGKRAIYNTQGKFSHVAMCFDEIPIVSSAQGKTGITDMSVRYFDHSLVKEKATNTGKNLKEQILQFRDMGSVAKPMLIMQGNDLQSFQDWVNYVCDVLGPLVSDVHGISVAGTSLGGGPMEDVVRAAASTILDFPEGLNVKNVHILGLGAPARFLPYVPFKELLTEHNISFDSTTHTHAVFKGMLIDGLRSLAWDKLRMPEKESIIERVNKVISESTDVRVTLEMVENVYKGSIKYEKKTGKLGVDCEHFIFTTVALLAFMVSTCLDTVQSLFNRGKLYGTVADNRGGMGAYNALQGVDNPRDFNKWYASFSRYLKSDKVRSSNEQSSSLEAFF